MAPPNYASAVRVGTMAAERLHQKLGLRSKILQQGGNVDIFSAIQLVELPLLLRPLDGLLGAYLREPKPGVLVTTRRPMSIQRFTAAHELGHYILDHEPSLDDDSILRRMPMASQPAETFQEVEADAFASAFLLPRWLIASHAQRQSWTVQDFRRPSTIYQLSLRIGASYEATCWTLSRNNLITNRQVREMLLTSPRDLKVGLLSDHKPQDYRGDVWLLTERDAGCRIDGSRNDLFVIRLEEHAGAGYVWDIDQLRKSGFAVVRDQAETIDPEGIGGPSIRRIIAGPSKTFRGRLSLDERRPWETEQSLSSLDLEFDLTGPEEEGLSRAERRVLLEAA